MQSWSSGGEDGDVDEWDTMNGVNNTTHNLSPQPSQHLAQVCMCDTVSSLPPAIGYTSKEHAAFGSSDCFDVVSCCLLFTLACISSLTRQNGAAVQPYTPLRLRAAV